MLTSDLPRVELVDSQPGPQWWHITKHINQQSETIHHANGDYLVWNYVVLRVLNGIEKSVKIILSIINFDWCKLTFIYTCTMVIKFGNNLQPTKLC